MSETTHTVTIGGKRVAYTARAGHLVLKEEEGKKQASFFSIAYVRSGVKDTSTRPVVFSFNGGPGLVFGVAPPRRLRPPSGRAGPAGRAVARAGTPRRQRALPARRRRPRVHRPGEHRVQPGHPRGGGQEVPPLPKRHRVGRRVHPPLADAERPLGTRPSSSPASRTGPPGRRRWPGTCSTGTACTSTGRSWCRPSSTSGPRPSTPRRGPSTGATTSPTSSSSPPTPPPPGSTGDCPPTCRSCRCAGCSTRSRRGRRPTTPSPCCRGSRLGDTERAKWSSPRWPGTPGFRPSTSTAATSASRSCGSARSCSGTSAAPSAGSTPGTPASTASRPGR